MPTQRRAHHERPNPYLSHRDHSRERSSRGGEQGRGRARARARARGQGRGQGRGRGRGRGWPNAWTRSWPTPQQDFPTISPTSPGSVLLPAVPEERDFAQLAQDAPGLARFLVPRSGRTRGPGEYTVDFHRAGASAALEEALLRVDYGLDVSILADRLCPGVPGRAAYVQWVDALLSRTEWVKQHVYVPSASSSAPSSVLTKTRKVLDIGTGHVAIYGLLGCALFPSWRVTGTEIDPVSLAHARDTVRTADLHGSLDLTRRICLVLRSPEDPLLLPPPTERALGPGGTSTTDENAWAATMCNPPFYASEDARLDQAEGKMSRAPGTTDSGGPGTPSELVTAGGEVAFVRRMVDESLAAHSPRSQAPFHPLPSPQDTWYTSLLGHKASVDAVLSILHRHGVRNITTTTLRTSGPTRRWTIAWSHGPVRPAHLVHLGHAPRSSLPPLAAWASRDGHARAKDDTDGGVVLIFHAAPWTRAGRRAAQALAAKAHASDQEEAPPPRLGAVLCAVQLVWTDDGRVVADWLAGDDQRIFDSWCRLAREELHRHHPERAPGPPGDAGRARGASGAARGPGTTGLPPFCPSGGAGTADGLLEGTSVTREARAGVPVQPVPAAPAGSHVSTRATPTEPVAAGRGQQVAGAPSRALRE